MVLVHAAALLLLVFFSAVFLGRFFAKVVEVLARYFAHLDLSIDTLGFLSIRGIKIKLKGNKTLVIEKISLQTKWTYSNSKKLFTVLFGKTEFLQDFNGSLKEVKPKVKTKTSFSFVTSHKERICQIINLFCQYVAICFSDACLVIRLPKDRQIKCQLQNGLELLANPTGKCLNSLLTASKIDAVITTVTDSGALDTLATFTIGAVVDVSLQPLQGISSADVQITLNSVKAVLNDGLLGKATNPSKLKTSTSLTEDAITSDTEQQPSNLLTSDLWLHLANVPEQAQLHIDSTSITFVNREQRNLSLDICQIAATFQHKQDEIMSSNQCDVNLVISGVSVTGIESCKLCSLNRLRFSSKLSENERPTNLAMSLSVESFHNNYVHNECMYWMEYLKSRLRERKTHIDAVQPIKRSHSRLPDFNVPVKMDVEMIDCSTCLFLTHKRPDQPLCRAVLASFVINADIPTKGVGDTVSDTQEIRLVTRLENAYIYFDALKTLPESSEEMTSYTLLDNPGLLPNTNSHVWGRTLAMGSCVVKCDVELPTVDDKAVYIHVRSEANCLAVEWSHQICQTLLHLTKQFTLGGATIKDKTEQHSKTTTKSTVSIDSEIRLRGVNMFYLGTRENGVDSFVYRTDMVVMAMSSGSPVLLDTFGVRISRMIGLKKVPYKCVLSGDLHNQCLSVPAIKVSVTENKVISVSLEDTLVDWSPTLHMALNERIEEVTQDVVSLKDILFQHEKLSEEKETTQEARREEKEGQRTTQTTQPGICVKCDISRFKLQMETSSSTSFGVELRKSTVNLEGSDVTVAMDTAVVLFDSKHTFTLEVVTLQRLQEVNEIKDTRKLYSNLQTQNNTTWIISAQETRIFFPYQFDFATSRSELVKIAKMLKTLHKKPRDPQYIGPLPPDLWLRFEKIIFEIEDDPFEVKLGINYTLLLDEAKQWSNRMETLQNRLHTIRMTPGNLLTVHKEILLRHKLLEKNAELYIQRSKSLHKDTSTRKRLLVWEFEGLDLKVLADASYHGKTKAVEMMTKLNSESPYPETDVNFSTLWCRTVKGKLESHCCKLRDYPQPIVTSKQVTLSGTFLAAEQTAKTQALYDSSITIKKPWDDMVVQRSLTILKYYYDLDFDVDTLELAWGVDTEPGLAMVSLAFDRLSKPSKDPSKPLPFYDKIRLLLHGRLHLHIQKWLMFLSAARNPYETTERMEVDWIDVDLLWTNGRIEILGDFDLQTRTASRYDDRQVLHLPAFKVSADMTWNCMGNPDDHFCVMPFAPSKLPELAANQVHDSYAAFRSQSLSLHLSLQTAMDKTKSNSLQGPPYVYLYASTFRWFKKYQEVVLRYTSRPTKRGKYFNRITPKKKSLGRHYKEISLSLNFPELSVWYWGSFSQQRGFELKCGLGSLYTQYRLALRPFSGGLTRRTAADWTATKLHIQMKQLTCHLYGLEQADGQEEGEEAEDVSSIDLEPTKYYFLTTESLEYSRQDSRKQQERLDESEPDSQSYNHQLVCHGSKGVWTLTNRRIIFGLFEAYTNAELLKKNLSADALKVTIVSEKKKKASVVSPDVSGMKPRSMSLLQKLVSEKDSKFTVFTEEGTGTVEPAETALQGVSLCAMDDVIAHTWHIKMVNSQILLQGTETKGGVLVTAGTTTVQNRLHRPIWNKTELLNKKTWVGRLENLQYFATVSPDDSVNLNNIPWLDISVITGRQSQQKTGFDMADLADIVGSGEAVGGVVTAVVGGATAGPAQDVPQLQRIVARCGCEFYFVNFNTEVDSLASSYTPNSVLQSPASNHLRVNRLRTVDTYTIRHKLLEISTNSAQYLMLIDIVNNVVLYTDPKEKEAIERLQKMTFRLQLSASEDQRGRILKQQNIVRSRQAEMRSLHRNLYELNLLRKQALDNQELTEAMVQLERNISHKKELLNSASTELKLLISAYKDFQMNLSSPTPEKAPSAEATKLAEVHFNHVSWQLNQADGQLEIADVTFRNFSYSKTTLSDATIEHRFEVPKFHVRNLLPNSIYKDVISQHMVSGQGQKDRAVMVRLYCRVKPPVAGIGVKEHLEVNVCPLSVGLTYRLFSKIMAFFFPQRAHEYESDVADFDLMYRGVDEKDLGDDDLFSAADLEDNQPKSGNLKRCPSTSSSISSSSDTSVESTSLKSKKNLVTSHTDSSPTSPGPKDKGKKKSIFYRSLEEADDLEKMKERASKNHSFIYVKVTQVLLCVSYKGEKEKNIVDVHNFNLTLPTLEYHNRTWTWHDVLIAMKKDCVNVLVAQIIKEKLHLKGAYGNEMKDAKSQSREEDKATLLFGDRSKIEKKKNKKSLLGKLVKKTRSPKPSGLLQPDGAGPEPVNLEGQDFQESDDDEEDSGKAQEAQTQ